MGKGRKPLLSKRPLAMMATLGALTLIGPQVAYAASPSGPLQNPVSSHDYVAYSNLLSAAYSKLSTGQQGVVASVRASLKTYTVLGASPAFNQTLQSLLDVLLPTGPNVSTSMNDLKQNLIALGTSAGVSLQSIDVVNLVEAFKGAMIHSVLGGANSDETSLITSALGSATLSPAISTILSKNHVTLQGVFSGLTAANSQFVTAYQDMQIAAIAAISQIVPGDGFTVEASLPIYDFDENTTTPLLPEIQISSSLASLFPLTNTQVRTYLPSGLIPATALEWRTASGTVVSSNGQLNLASIKGFTAPTALTAYIHEFPVAIMYVKAVNNQQNNNGNGNGNGNSSGNGNGGGTTTIVSNPTGSTAIGTGSTPTSVNLTGSVTTTTGSGHSTSNSNTQTATTTVSQTQLGGSTAFVVNLTTSNSGSGSSNTSGGSGGTQSTTTTTTSLQLTSNTLSQLSTAAHNSNNSKLLVTTTSGTFGFSLQQLQGLLGNGSGGTGGSTGGTSGSTTGSGGSSGNSGNGGGSSSTPALNLNITTSSDGSITVSVQPSTNSSSTGSSNSGSSSSGTGSNSGSGSGSSSTGTGSNGGSGSTSNTVTMYYYVPASSNVTSNTQVVVNSGGKSSVSHVSGVMMSITGDVYQYQITGTPPLTFHLSNSSFSDGGLNPNVSS